MVTTPQTLANRLLCGALLTAALLAAGAASAMPTVVAANRVVVIGDNDGGAIFGPNSPYTGVGPFDDSVSAVLGPLSPHPVTATQSSNIGPGGFSGSGHVQVNFSVRQEDAVFANSFFDLIFSLSTAHNYSLTGLLQASMDGGRGFGQILLTGGPGPIALDFAAQDFGNVPVAVGGVLDAGTYHLMVEANIDNGGAPLPGGFMGGTADFSFDLALREITVPEPASLALLGFGLAGFGLVRRRRC